MTRRIRASHKLNSESKPAQPEFSQYLFNAAENAGSSLPYVPQAHTSSQELPANKIASQSFTASYDKFTSTERG
ncbi:MAG: hypothetical protein ABI177_02445 [Edaphobacter sp.]